MTNKISGKILTANRKDYQAIRPFIVHHFRRINGTRNYDILASFGTLRSTDLTKTGVRIIFWQKVNAELERLEKEGYSKNDLDSIRQKFSAVIQPPISVPIVKRRLVITDAELEDLRSRFIL